MVIGTLECYSANMQHGIQVGLPSGLPCEVRFTAKLLVSYFYGSISLIAPPAFPNSPRCGLEK